MADYFIVCKGKCGGTYVYHPKVRQDSKIKSHITIAFGAQMATNADMPRVPKCPKCGEEGEWLITMG